MADDDLEKIKAVDSIIGPICDVVLHQQEYFKTLLTLNTATLLITITFWEKIVRIPNCKFLILLPLFSFALSLWASLREMRLFSHFHAAFVTIKLDFINALSTPDLKREEFQKKAESTRKAINDIGKQIDKFQKIADYSYFIGLGSLLLFAVLSLVLKTSG